MVQTNHETALTMNHATAPCAPGGHKALRHCILLLPRAQRTERRPTRLMCCLGRRIQVRLGHQGQGGRQGG
jgi:hypothetical protein